MPAHTRDDALPDARLASLEQLQAWLASRHIDTSLWGTGKAKSVANLWHELSGGEITLQDEPPLRKARVTVVLVLSGDRVLVEDRQILSDARVRERGRPPSEKMKPGESPLEAAYRCLSEELGVAAEAVTLYEQTLVEETRIDSSPSYPGLPTRYSFYTIQAQVAGLPEGEFTTDEGDQEQGVAVARHVWQWRHRETISLAAPPADGGAAPQ